MKSYQITIAIIIVIKVQIDGQETNCGRRLVHDTPLITNGFESNVGDWPWHSAIYHTSIYSFTYKCGGTVLNSNEAENFQVGAGKYYRDFNAMEPTKPQFSNVAKIVHKREYRDFYGYYALDIAVLILTDHFQFNLYIKPICVERDLNFDEKQVPPGLIGKVAGWGLETSSGEGSTELKYIDLPAVEYDQCKQALPRQLQKFITDDKFCAGYTSGQSACQGSGGVGGGGFVIAKTVGARKLHFLKGVVSAYVSISGSCYDDSYSLFTNIQYHIEMIKYYNLRQRPSEF